MHLTKAQRLALRFSFVYVFLYISPIGLFDVLPGMEWLSKHYEAAWDAAMPWVAAHVFGIAGPLPLEQTGSGDRTVDYVRLACTVTLALLITAIWSWLGRRPPFRDRDVWTILRTYVRYALGMILLGYGFAKVFKSQFPHPRPEQLLTPFGNISPMGLVWRFMGYSTPYTIFTGLAEIGGGVLLFFRRTTTLGALVLVGVMANVVMLNFCYDVPVKVFSAHLLLFAVLLLLPDARRLAAVFLFNRAAPAADQRRHDLLVRFRGTRVLVKLAFLFVVIGGTAYQGYDSYTQWGDGSPRGALYGIYEVETFAKDGATLPPALTETGRWRRVAVNSKRWGIFLMDDSRRNYWMEYDSEAGKLKLKQDDEKEYVLTVSRPDPDHLQVEGTLGEERLDVRMKKVDVAAMPLNSRGFRWINEFPFNR